ncbi:hypothetical protein [Sphingomonas sp. OTU376]|uniref:hypothetical protein n=1 Tax=Sphingomonas sp. OTU376 TaxID=3043863 RepID=UPI00313C6452
MDIPSPEELVSKIETFIARHDMAETRFGRDAVGDPNVLSDLRAGQRLPGLIKLRRIAKFMASKDAEKAGADHVDTVTADAGAGSSGKIAKISAPAGAA